MDDFEELDQKYDAAHKAWGDHVDVCPDCRRSVFACKEGLRLSGLQNIAWNAARRAWLKRQSTQGTNTPA